MKWNDKTRTLVIEACDGEYPGMLLTRKFNVVLASKGNTIAKTMKYEGKKVKVRL